MVGADRDAGKCARARAVAAAEKPMHAEYAEHKRGLAQKDRFRQTAASDVVCLFESHANEKDETLSQFEVHRPARGQGRSCASHQVVRGAVAHQRPHTGVRSAANVILR